MTKEFSGLVEFKKKLCRRCRKNEFQTKNIVRDVFCSPDNI